MQNLTKKNNANQIVVASCPLNECFVRNPHCENCFHVSQYQIRDIIKKLYEHEHDPRIFYED